MLRDSGNARVSGAKPGLGQHHAAVSQIGQRRLADLRQEAGGIVVQPLEQRPAVNGRHIGATGDGIGRPAQTENAVRTITEALRQKAGPSLRVTEVSPGMVTTDFIASMTDAEVQAAMRRCVAEAGIPPEAIARGIGFAIEQSPEVGCAAW